ncbi:MAG: hypothetical protein IJA03_00800 [Bacteroidaceae bacterium]|nr:hypothetical protein [Bacteroidaceae bacterium]MBQ4163266.1 hypothetical protein [Parabacteroides sp.]
MKVVRLSELSDEELNAYHNSALYKLTCSDYRFCDIHLDYYREYFGEKWTDESLIVYDKSGYCISLIMFSNGEELSFFGSPTDVIYDDSFPTKSKNQAFGELFVKLEQLIKEKNIKALKFFENPYFLLKYYEQDGITFSSKIIYENSIDLNQSENDIKMGVRKSYKSLINWGQRNLDIRIYDKTNMTDEIMSEFEDFHITVAKRHTRSHESWMLQSRAVKQGMGYVVMGYYNNELVTATLILNGNKDCYYGVCVNDRDLMAQNLPIGHYGLFCSILLAKEKGFEKFNFGDVSNNDDPKVNAIVKYKRGFSNLLHTRIACQANFNTEANE